MSASQMMFFGYTWVVGTIACLIIEGRWIGNSEMVVMNNLTTYKIVTSGNWSAMSVFNFFRFVTKLLTWDYSFFSGEWAIMRFILGMTLSVGAIYGFMVIMIGVIQSLFGRRV